MRIYGMARRTDGSGAPSRWWAAARRMRSRRPCSMSGAFFDSAAAQTASADQNSLRAAADLSADLL